MSELIIRYAFDGQPAKVTLMRSNGVSTTYDVLPDDIADIVGRAAVGPAVVPRLSTAAFQVRSQDLIVAPITGGCRVAKKYLERDMRITYAPGQLDARTVKLTLPPLWWLVDYTPDGHITHIRLAVELEERVSAWPYGNVHQHGGICWGNYNVGISRGTPDEVDTYFFSLPFNSDIPANAAANALLGQDGAKLSEWYKTFIGTQTIDAVVGGEVLRHPVPRPQEVRPNDGQQQQTAGPNAAAGGRPITLDTLTQFANAINRAGAGAALDIETPRANDERIVTTLVDGLPTVTVWPAGDDPRADRPVRADVHGGGLAGDGGNHQANRGGDRERRDQ